MRGQVFKVLTDSYTVKSNKTEYTCLARGLLKIKGDGISVGDNVEFENGVISKILERKNKFIRPNVANVDVIVAVISAEPKPDFYLLDKLLLNAVKSCVEVIIVVNKADLAPELYQKISDEYSPLVSKVFSISAKTGKGVEELKDAIDGKLSVLAGQSAVGKTSIVNAIFGFNLKVGELSDKILRGKHTTTRSEIFDNGSIKIIDSPGFAVIDADVSIEELPECYEEYFKVSNQCRFRGCSHVNEPDCKVKELVETGEFSKERYKRYVEIYNEIAKRRINYEKN